MAMPGFTAERSLSSGNVSYTHGSAAAYTGPSGEISPEFLDFIKEAFESVGSALSTAAQAAASAIASSLSNLGKSGGGGGQPFVCSTFVGQFFKCNGASPAISAAQVTSQCISRAAEFPALLPVCAGLGVSIYALAGEYCKNPSQGITPFLQRACPN